MDLTLLQVSQTTILGTLKRVISSNHFLNKFSGDGNEAWSKRNQALAAILAVVLLLIGFTVYHFQDDEQDDYALESELVENEENNELADNEENENEDA